MKPLTGPQTGEGKNKASCPLERALAEHLLAGRLTVRAVPHQKADLEVPLLCFFEVTASALLIVVPLLRGIAHLRNVQNRRRFDS